MRDRVEVHRTSWAELESVYSKLLTVGEGEAITEPIYFGKCFYDKPLLTYAVEPAEAVEDSPTSLIRDYASAEPIFHAMPRQYNYFENWISDEGTSFVGWRPEFGDKWCSWNITNLNNEMGVNYTEHRSAVGFKLWMANVLANFSTLDDPATNNYVPITGRVWPGTAVQITLDWKVTADAAAVPTGTPPNTNPNGRLTYVWHSADGTELGTSTSSPMGMVDASWEDGTHSAYPPAGAKYVGVYLWIDGDAGGFGPSGYGDWMTVQFANAYTISGLTKPTDLMTAHWADYGYIEDGGFEHQAWAGFIPRWDHQQIYMYARGFYGWWMQSPPLEGGHEGFAVGAGSYVVSPTMDLYVKTGPYNSETNGIEVALPSISSADTYEDVWLGGEVIEPVEGWFFYGQVDTGGNGWFQLDGDLYTYFQPKLAGAEVPNDMFLAIFHLDEPHNTQNPWKYSLVRPGGVVQFGAGLLVDNIVEGQFEVRGELDLYDSDNDFLGTITSPTGVPYEMSTSLNGAIDSSQTDISSNNGAAGWEWPEFPFVVQIGSEQIYVPSHETWGERYWKDCVRGYNSTTPASHNNGSTITYLMSPLGKLDFEEFVTIPSAVGGGTPHYCFPRLSFVDTSTGDYSSMKVRFYEYATFQPGRFASVYHEVGMAHVPQATSEWLISREGPSPNNYSKTCAAYVFGDETESRWLSYNYTDGSTFVHGWYGSWYRPPLDDYVGTPEWIHWVSHTSRVWSHDPDELPLTQKASVANPPIDKLYYRFESWADSSVTVEVYIVHTQGEPTDGSHWEGHDHIPHSVEVQHSGGGWETFEVEFPMEHHRDDWWLHDVALFYRVKGGSPGQEVRVDNFKHSYDYTNARSFPETTVGVAEWIKDDRGLYVGARLWVKVGD